MTDQPVTVTTAVSYFIQSRPAPSQPWQRASGVVCIWESRDTALEQLATRRERQPGWEHRLRERITSVTERTVHEETQR